ncbi:high affinity immunoglobulin gamma Fc receptor I-like isoform X2 [Esox lucius]|uniref:high affinity immunoglobulin gamma Fc receptor I-like isoform X2 n=1 Tax=Esox lucius TaxID=8010 RepID=UPI001476D04C|nr:high affinity immunoglobulin gamma Fc receptor I-like isoform X2 [Esox lucius]
MQHLGLLLLMFSTLLYSSVSQGSVTLIIIPNRAQFFEYESVSLRCEVQGNSAGWKLKRYTLTGRLSDCGTDWGKQQVSSCVMSVMSFDSGVYWWESWSGKHSNAVNITVHNGPVIMESPALPVTEGLSVTLNCRYQGTPSNHTVDFYKDGSLIRTETKGEMTIPAVSQSDQGLYSCRHPELGRSPESRMTVTDLSPPASLIISPNRSQFFQYESVSLSCDVQGNSSGWGLKRFTVTGRLSDCGTDWGKHQRSACIITVMSFDSGVYWCESWSGKHSNAVNMNVHDIRELHLTTQLISTKMDLSSGQKLKER